MATAQKSDHRIRKGDRLPLLAVTLSGVVPGDLVDATTCTFQLYPQNGGTPVTQAGTIEPATKVATLAWSAGSTAVADLYEGFVAWTSRGAKAGTFGPFYVLIYDPAEV